MNDSKNNSANYPLIVDLGLFASPQEMCIISSVASGGVPGCALTT